jgi:putative ubiquitin-RnfH superfamily antitoxin RatB of RatAB toxin-antitoxin module
MPEIEIIYPKSRQEVVHVKIPYSSNLTISKALEISGLLIKYPEIISLSIGVFKEIKSLEALLKPYDRIEIYRPLLINPKDSRRARAKNKDK